ncbi:hypothetical protein L6164_017153 [Bauhinia variegata]|uniref:Uncharacterized protein n=1 Tax=Bauhinia variegata TaxID=167791 RepID=A0ACB9N8W2_BAUVA|nr:hypothetical protein L6164_017153 [Bauhinia variegata]
MKEIRKKAAEKERKGKEKRGEVVKRTGTAAKDIVQQAMADEYNQQKAGENGSGKEAKWKQRWSKALQRQKAGQRRWKGFLEAKGKGGRLRKHWVKVNCEGARKEILRVIVNTWLVSFQLLVIHLVTILMKQTYG